MEVVTNFECVHHVGVSLLGSSAIGTIPVPLRPFIQLPEAASKGKGRPRDWIGPWKHRRGDGCERWFNPSGRRIPSVSRSLGGKCLMMPTLGYLGPAEFER